MGKGEEKASKTQPTFAKKLFKQVLQQWIDMIRHNQRILNYLFFYRSNPRLKSSVRNGKTIYQSYSKGTFCRQLEMEAISPCHKCREAHHLEKDSDPKPYNRVSPLLPMYRRPFHGRLHLNRQPKEHLNKQETERHLNPRKKEYKKL